LGIWPGLGFGGFLLLGETKEVRNCSEFCAQRGEWNRCIRPPFHLLLSKVKAMESIQMSALGLDMRLL